MVKKNVNEEVVAEVENEVENDGTSVVSEAFKEVYGLLSENKQWYTNTLGKVKELEKLMKKMQKETEKKMNKNKKNVKREPSGFAKPTPISKELCDFLQKPIGTEMARTEVTKYLTQYIKEHNLQFEEDKRKIKPDAKLKKLLNLKKDDQVTYFNLQKYMKPHFASKSSASQ